jgi:hypothetical protein
MTAPAKHDPALLKRSIISLACQQRHRNRHAEFLSPFADARKCQRRCFGAHARSLLRPLDKKLSQTNIEKLCMPSMAECRAFSMFAQLCPFKKEVFGVMRSVPVA